MNNTMKKLRAVLALAILALPMSLIAQDHPHGNMNHEKNGMNHEKNNMSHDNNMTHNDGEMMHYEVGTDFQSQLNEVYQASLALNNAFVAGDASKAKTYAATMSNKMNNVDMSLLKGDAHMAWMGHMKLINSGLTAISVSNDIAEQRTSFAGVSDGLYKSIKSFGVGETVYYHFCPMKKSSWLTNSEEIKNPYFGSMMLTCGSTKEVIN